MPPGFLPEFPSEFHASITALQMNGLLSATCTGVVTNLQRQSASSLHFPGKLSCTTGWLFCNSACPLDHHTTRKSVNRDPNGL